MSEFAIRNYLKELETLKFRSGKGNESSIRSAMIKLIDEYARAKDLRLVAEVAVQGTKGRKVTPDGTLKDSLVLDRGYWESKDEYDDLELEIAKKFDKGYPNDNIFFEDSTRAVLYQNGIRIMECSFADTKALDKLLRAFVSFERTEVREFRQAIELFKADVPKVTGALRDLIITKAESLPDYIAKRDSFLSLMREVVNPAITPEDIREMVIQHILTSDIFNTIFDEPYFHQDNNIAQELEKLVSTFFTRDLRQQLLTSIKHYYDKINARAAQIADHHEKQMLLKVVYETFYKSYNPQKADRLGVVYTPNEIVRFMIDSTDYLLQKHFGKMLEDKGVEILDPATGTGTFICDIIDHISTHKLEYKYKHELHANEVEILPYYIANLNIEFTYKQKMQSYAEFENLCFVDTLDNYVNFQKDGEILISSVTDENAERIKRQNERKISVIIGNPPYNANQKNENENNKNREYPEIDKRIKDTFIKFSTAQKSKSYDMYRRFYRWAMDRVDRNGIIAFITNRSFIDAREADGFRKCVSDEFDYAYIIDTKSDVRQNPKIAGTTHNVFGIQLGVAIMFLIRKETRENASCNIQYITMQDDWHKDTKLQWLSSNKLKDVPFEKIEPDKDNNWINQTDNDWDDLLPLSPRDNTAKRHSPTCLFRNGSIGLNTARDEWVYDPDADTLISKVMYLVSTYNSDLSKIHSSPIATDEYRKSIDYSIKWTRAVLRDLVNGVKYQFHKEQIVKANYRPYVSNLLYYDNRLNEMPSHTARLFHKANTVICLNISASKEFHVLATDSVMDYHYTGDTACFGLYWYNSEGIQTNNIPLATIKLFMDRYATDSIQATDIFHYVYAVLHDPQYRRKYEQNLKRSLPRIPLYENFRQWAKWGAELMALHISFESVDEWDLELRETGIREDGSTPKAKLKADKEHGIIILDEDSSLAGIPSLAWEYKLGNRSALEWILDQYKEKKPKDPTIARLFNTYRFADYKDKVIDLIKRVTMVSVRTMEIVREMEKVDKI